MDLVRLLIDHQAWQHAPMALALAAGRGQVETVEFLVEAKMDPNCTEDLPEKRSHSTPALYLAAMCNQLDTVKMLISLSADLNCRNPNPVTVIRGQNLDITERLTGMTALMAAAQFADEDVVMTLAEMRADPTLTAFEGRSPVDVASTTNIYSTTEVDAKWKARQRKQQCAFCGVTKLELGRPLMQCNRCKAASYCSVEHQRSHWPEHKHEQCGCMRVVRLMGKGEVLSMSPVDASLDVGPGGYVTVTLEVLSSCGRRERWKKPRPDDYTFECFNTLYKLV